jgi:uncharacterized membrane protein
VQCLVTAAGATAYAAAFEIPAAGWPTLTSHIVYTAVFTGIVCTTLAFLAQTVAQRVVPATHVALIYAMEPVFAALASWWLLGEMLTDQRAAGCGLILLGMLCGRASLHAERVLARRRWRGTSAVCPSPRGIRRDTPGAGGSRRGSCRRRTRWWRAAYRRPRCTAACDRLRATGLDR